MSPGSRQGCDLLLSSRSVGWNSVDSELRAKHFQRFPDNGPTLARSAGVKFTPFGFTPVVQRLFFRYSGWENAVAATSAPASGGCQPSVEFSVT